MMGRHAPPIAMCALLGALFAAALGSSAAAESVDTLRAQANAGTVGVVSGGIDIGIVQSDVLAYAKRERLYPSIDKSVQYIVKLYDEELHILAANDIAKV